MQEMRYILDLTRPYDNLLATEGAQNQSFVWGNELLSASGESNFHYLQDHLGSPVRLVGADVDEALAFDEFGVPLVGAGNIHQPFGFTGYQTDDVSGLYFAQARYFDPVTSRFSAEDTHWHPGNMIFGDTPGNYHMPDIDAVMQSASLYSYCMNNPLMYVDRDGCAATYANKGLVNRWGKDYHKVVATVGNSSRTSTHTFYIRDNEDVIRYCNAQNDLSSALGSRDLAEGMLDAFRDIKGYDLPDRTVTGVQAELLLHDLLYRLGILPESTIDAGIGSLRIPILASIFDFVPGGNDHNAFLFELLKFTPVLGALEAFYATQGNAAFSRQELQKFMNDLADLLSGDYFMALLLNNLLAGDCPP